MIHNIEFIVLVPLAALGMVYGYACAEGKREAKYFHLKEKREDLSPRESEIINSNKDHFLYTIQRIIFFAGITGFYFELFPWYKCLMMTICLAVTFPLFHDGWYYVTRDNLDPTIYMKRFTDQSTTSNAVEDKSLSPFATFERRMIMAIIGASGIVAIIMTELVSLIK